LRAMRGTEKTIGVHVHVTAGEVVSRGITNRRGQRANTGGTDGERLDRKLHELLERAALAAVFVAELLLGGTAAAKFPEECGALPLHQRGLRRQIESEIVEERIDSAQRQPPPRVESLIAGERFEHAQHRLAVGVEDLLRKNHCL